MACWRIIKRSARLFLTPREGPLNYAWCKGRDENRLMHVSPFHVLIFKAWVGSQVLNAWSLSGKALFVIPYSYSCFISSTSRVALVL
jgi:hypothetical protein